jgi:hypothetical protein
MNTARVRFSEKRLLCLINCKLDEVTFQSVEQDQIDYNTIISDLNNRYIGVHGFVCKHAQVRTHEHTHTRAPTYTRLHTRMHIHARTHVHTRARTHTHVQTYSVIECDGTRTVRNLLKCSPRISGYVPIRLLVHSQRSYVSWTWGMRLDTSRACLLVYIIISNNDRLFSISHAYMNYSSCY